MARICVGLVGATGETGSSIVAGLLKDGSFEIVALTRPSSLSKPANVALEAKGVELRALDVLGDESVMPAALNGIDILISAGPRDLEGQRPLATAAKIAGIKRFVPCAFAPIMPPGVHMSRDAKEAVYSHVKRLHLPFTIIDVGWWYQISFPRLPSAKIDYAVGIMGQGIPGDGNQLSARIDLQDIGKYVAKIIQDERTLNKMVFVYNELWCTNEVYSVLEKLSGETIPRDHTSAEEYQRLEAEADAKLKQNSKDILAEGQKKMAQYYLSWGIRGENTPQFAEYLGYLDGKQLYPDLDFTSFESYLKGVVNGEAKRPYDEIMPVLDQLKKERT